jgi:hypothetical protein
MNTVYAEQYDYKGLSFNIQVSKDGERLYGQAFGADGKGIPNAGTSFPVNVTEEAMRRGIIGDPIEEIVRLVKGLIRGQVEYGSLGQKTDIDILLPGEYTLESFENFERRLSEIEAALKNKMTASQLRISPPLFRGQRDASWRLNSTLERATDFPMKIERYLRKIRNIHKPLEVFTDKKWDFDFEKAFNFSGSFHLDMELYELMVYLRHHGYPSPLLDWSESPFVAAFFAFNDIDRQDQNDTNDRVAIYIYFDNIGQGKTWWEGASHVETLGPNIVAHKRHHIQQCQYTVCVKEGREKEREVRYYDSHQAFFDRKEKDQSVLQKYTLPFSERNKVLRKLKLMNINPYTLFGSDDSLVQHLAIKSFVLDE